VTESLAVAGDRSGVLVDMEFDINAEMEVAATIGCHLNIIL